MLWRVYEIYAVFRFLKYEIRMPATIFVDLVDLSVKEERVGYGIPNHRGAL